MSRSTHQEKELQVSSIMDIVTDTNTPIVVTDDFNISYYYSKAYFDILKPKLTNSIELISDEYLDEILNEGTFINGHVLDYIFIDTMVYDVTFGSIAQEEYIEISDHYPYIVRETRIIVFLKIILKLERK